MLDKKTLTFRVIAGLALLYVGGNLIFSSVKEQPEHYVIYALAGAAFALLGLAWGGLAVKKLATHDYKEMMDDDADREGNGFCRGRRCCRYHGRGQRK